MFGSAHVRNHTSTVQSHLHVSALFLTAGASACACLSCTAAKVPYSSALRLLPALCMHICRDSMLPPGLSGLSLVVARYSVRCIFQRLATKYKQDDAAAQADQVCLQAYHTLNLCTFQTRLWYCCKSYTVVPPAESLLHASTSVTGNT